MKLKLKCDFVISAVLKDGIRSYVTCISIPFYFILFFCFFDAGVQQKKKERERVMLRESQAENSGAKNKR